MPETSGRRRRKDARPSEIAAAALAVFAEKGFAAARLEDVAARAGVAKGTVYLYFSTKEALFEAVVRDAFRPLLDGVGRARMDTSTSCADQLRGVLTIVYRELVATERRQIMRLLIAEAERFPDLVSFYHREIVSRGRGLLAAILADGVARGEFRDGPAVRQPEVVIGPAIMAAVWKLVFEPVEPLDLDRYAAAHLDLVMAGLSAREEAPPQVRGSARHAPRSRRAT
ncbi:MAG: TetR/AcrR family transcriptional regulator [Methylobacteriaceae bacterium]|nr:TetR/AcrR family transcriptional regulator [Methylobacteriaceae bacterium]